MAIWSNILPSQVLNTINGGSFASGDTIKVVSAPGDTTINFGLNYVPTKYFTLISEEAATPIADPFGYAALSQPAKTWEARATSVVTILGTLNCYTGAGSMSTGLFDFRNFNWKINQFPDWTGQGQTWASLGWPGQLVYIRPGTLTGAGLKLYMEHMHFEGPQEFLPAVTDGFGDSPLGSYYIDNNTADATYSMSRADGTNVAPFSYTSSGLVGRGPWPGQGGSLRNQFNNPTYGNVLYNTMGHIPDAVIATQVTQAIFSRCSFRNMGSGITADGAAGMAFNGLAEYCWFENLYNDWMHISGSAVNQTYAQSEFHIWREVGSVITGCGNLSGLDLGNPHIDRRQYYVAAGNYGPRVMVKCSVDDAGVQTGKSDRATYQDFFGSGTGSIPQIKVFNCMNAGPRNKSFSTGANAIHIDGLQSFVVPQAAVPIDVNSSGVLPPGAGSLIYASVPAVGNNSKGLIKNTNAQSFLTDGVASPLMINTNVVPSSSISTTIAPDPNTATTSIAMSYSKYRQPNWPTDVVAFLQSAYDFSTIGVSTQPPTVQNATVSATTQSALERMSLGDINSTATIVPITPGLQWREMSFDGTTQTQAWSSSSGTVNDGRHLQLQAPAASTAATGKTYQYTVNGQLQTWTVVTKGAWNFPSISKAGTGQWQRPNTPNAAFIASPTTLQTQRGMIWARFSLAQPATSISNGYWINGSSGRGLQCNINAPNTGTTYTLNFQFGTSGGSKVGQIATGNLTYGKVYDFFYQIDLSLGTSNNVGYAIWNVTDNVSVKAWTLASEASTTSFIAWSYNQTNNGPVLFPNLNLPQFYGLAIWAGESYLTADGTQPAYPGLMTPEQLGVNGRGITGNKPLLMFLGETTSKNYGTDPNVWTCTDTLTNIGGTNIWANPPGTGPKQALGLDPLSGFITNGSSFTVTARCYGSNELTTITPTLSSGLTLTGGPTFSMAENARTVSFTVTANAVGNQSISIANNVGYSNPSALPIPVGKSLGITVMPGSGYTGSNYPATLSFNPAAPTLGTLALTVTSSNAGNLWIATITGRTPGSTITATSSDSTVLTVNDSNVVTVSGTFTTAGTPIISLVETLGGATGSPKTTTVNFTVNYNPGAVVFTQATNLARNGSSIGITDATTGVMSFWIKGTVGDNTNNQNSGTMSTWNMGIKDIVTNSGSGTTYGSETVPGFNFMFDNAGGNWGTTRVNLSDSSGGVSGHGQNLTAGAVQIPGNGLWTHFLIAWDTGQASGSKKFKMLRNGVDLNVPVTELGGSVPSYAVNISSALGFGINQQSSTSPGGAFAMSEVIYKGGYNAFPSGVFDTTLINKFYNAGKPVNPGTTGATAFGSAADFYHTGNHTNFLVENGATAAAMTLTGTLYDAPYGPAGPQPGTPYFAWSAGGNPSNSGATSMVTNTNGHTVKAGDIMVLAALIVDSSGTTNHNMQTPSGWNPVGSGPFFSSTNSAPTQLGVWTRTAAADNEALPTISWTGTMTRGISWSMAVIKNATAVIAGATQDNTTSTTNAIAPALLATGPNQQLVNVYAFYDTSASNVGTVTIDNTKQSVVIKPLDNNGALANIVIAVDTNLTTGAGTTGTRTATQQVNDPTKTASILIG